MSDTVSQTVTETVPPVETPLVVTEMTDAEAAAIAAGVSEDVEPVVEKTPETPPEAVEPEKTPDPEPVAPPVTPPPPAPDPAADQLRQQQEQAAQAWQSRVSEYERRLATQASKQAADGWEYDPYTDGKESAWLNLEGSQIQHAEMQYLRTQAQQTQEQARIQRQWNDFSAENPGVSVQKAQQAFNEEYNAAVKRFGHGPTATAYATAKWEARVELLKGHAKKAAEKAPKPPAPVPTGGRITPGNATVPAAAPNETPEDALVREMGGKQSAFRQFAMGR